MLASSEVLATLNQGRGVDDDQVKALSRIGLRLQHLEGIAPDGLDPVRKAQRRRVGVEVLQRPLRSIHSDKSVSAPGEGGQAPGPYIAEGVENPRALCQGR